MLAIAMPESGLVITLVPAAVSEPVRAILSPQSPFLSRLRSVQRRWGAGEMLQMSGKVVLPWSYSIVLILLSQS